MYYVCKPSKIQIYVNSTRKTMTQIKKEIGCDIIINGGIYNMSTFVPYCWLKADGKLLASDHYTYFGFGWNAYNLIMDSSVNIGKYQNFLFNPKDEKADAIAWAMENGISGSEEVALALWQYHKAFGK